MPGKPLLHRCLPKPVCDGRRHSAPFSCIPLLLAPEPSLTLEPKPKQALKPMSLNLHKELKLYYSISEVAEMFGVNETLLRFWEKEFPQISPKKTGRNIRQYTKEDVEQVRLIYNLVKVRGLKLAAAREALKKNKEGTQQTAEVVDKLRAIKAELESIRKELGA